MKQTLIYLGIILGATALAFGLIHARNVHQASLVSQCSTDVMVCPDGSTVPRSGPNCEFGICKQTPPSSIEEKVTEAVATTSTSSQIPFSTKKTTSQPTKPQPTTNLFTKLSAAASVVIESVTGAIGNNVATGIKETSSVTNNTPSQQKNTSNTPPQQQNVIDETRYTVKNNKLVDQNNNVIYTLPPSNTSGSSGPPMETHVVDAVKVNTVAPIIGAIPVSGLPGKYYLSENAFGQEGACLFANKIYILDVTTGEKTLMYEENSTTLSQEDPRACNSEMYLLATENEKLILKYHTIGTNMVCDSTWSEPEKTWYIDVTNLSKGTRRYVISVTSYTEAENYEATCRANLEATSTP